jgi:hypothetical protein
MATARKHPAKAPVMTTIVPAVEEANSVTVANTEMWDATADMG